MEDRLLVLRCKRGSTEALARVYEKYKRDLIVLAMALLNDTSAAEDVVHDVFVSFVKSIETFRLTGSLKGFLLTCVANGARNTNKARYQQDTNSDPPAATDSDTDDPPYSIICNEQLGQLGHAMAQLPYEQREVIMLRFQAGMTFKTIARSLDISINTAKSRYRYGLDKLQLLLDDEVER
ncbi:MAG: sigma-70 family RNA polymerase sigma factor [Phycisphaerales bacterium]|nr:MAG: sigma-70 family RNA polymerase sigma factor [Phycisphaerales bacterium]